MNWIRVLLVQFTVAVCIFFAADYSYTNFFRVEDGQEYVYRVRHDVYHHTLLPSFNGFGNWDTQPYRICTDGSGFKSDCDEVLETQKSFDIAFIGDSFTEAVGLPYEDSFVGMFALDNPQLNIANLGVSSYAPTVYRAKIEDLITNGYTFNHIFVFLDISDIQDESDYYRDSNGSILKGPNAAVTTNPHLLRLKSDVSNNFFLFKTAYLTIKNAYLTIKNAPLENGLNNVPKDVFSLERSEWTYNSSSTAYGDLGVRGAIEKAVQEMTLLYELLEENNIGLSVGVYPWPAQLYKMNEANSDSNLQSSIWKEFCLERCENFVDMFPQYYQLVRNSTLEKIYRNYYIQGDVHFNREGNRLIYRSLSTALNSEE